MLTAVTSKSEGYAAGHTTRPAVTVTVSRSDGRKRQVQGRLGEPDVQGFLQRPVEQRREQRK